MRTIPARAGQPNCSGRDRWHVRDHPRAGGATWLPAASMMARMGPSPRGRGNPPVLDIVFDDTRTIPARAGQPPGVRLWTRHPGDHPRAGGATISTKGMRKSAWGPSPRGRGNPSAARSCGSSPGTIPARAGATSVHRSLVAIEKGPSPRGRGQPAYRRPRRAKARDHPRAGGATLSPSSGHLYHSGPSPRGRGNRRRGCCVFWGSGTIPARAGQPLASKGLL